MIGLADASPLWFQAPSKQRTVKISYKNLTDWTWAGVNVKTVGSDYTISTGFALPDVGPNTTTFSFSGSSTIFELLSFSMGVSVNTTTAYFVPLATNPSMQFSTLEDGLVLTSEIWSNFTQRLSVITNN